LALPLRRCPNLSGLGLEVFRSTASGRRSENRAPTPSLSSGATPEFDHSRQSLDSRARSPIGRPFRIRTVERWRASACTEMNQRRRTDEDLAPTRRSEPLDAAPIRSRRGRPPKKLHLPRIDGWRSRHEPEGSFRTAPSDDPRPKSEDITAEPPRAEVASHCRPMREPAAPSLSATTRKSMTGRRVPPAKFSNWPSEEVQSSHHHFPFGFDSDEGERNAFTVPVQPPPIVADRQPAASCGTSGDRSSDRKRPSVDESTAFPRVIPSIPSDYPLRTVRNAAEGRLFRTTLSRPHRVVCTPNQTPEGDDRTCPKAVSGVSQQKSKTPSRGSLPFDGVRCADR